MVYTQKLAPASFLPFCGTSKGYTSKGYTSSVIAVNLIYGIHFCQED